MSLMVFNYSDLQTDLTTEARCNYIADERTNDSTLVFNYIVRLLQYQKERVENN